MKRIIAAVLILIMCLALCACSGVKQEVYDAAMSSYEAAKAGYEEATAKYDALKSKVEKYSTVIEALEKEDYDGAVEAVNAMRPVPEKRPSHEVVITMDNWEEYFELVEIPKATAFGELERLSYVFKLRDQYIELVDYDTPFKIDISHIDTYKGESNFDYDHSTNTLTLTGWRFRSNNDLKNTFSVSNLTLKQENEVDSNDYSAYHFCEIYSGNVFDGIQIYEVNIDNIKGSIYLYD